MPDSITGWLKQIADNIGGGGGGGGDVVITEPLGEKAQALAISIALSTEDKALLTALTAAINASNFTVQNDDTAFVAASELLRFGFLADETGTDSVDEGDVGLPRMTLDRKMRTVPSDEDCEYETVAASQTAQVLGPTGGTGDYIKGVLCIPTSVSPGVVTLLDNAISIPVFAGGTNSLLTLHPFFIPLGLKSVSGAWKITTGANISAIGIGNFT